MQIVESRTDLFKHRFSNGSMMFLFPPIAYVRSPGPSFPYIRLQQPSLSLTVLKLDGSSFGVEVSKTGTVGELKRVVEAAFDHLPNEGTGEVSWEHVWGQFCLSHEGEMLLTDRDYISMVGIKDGDQLQFIHCASRNKNFTTMESMGACIDEEDEPRKDERQKGEKEECLYEETIEDNQDGHWDLEKEVVSKRDRWLSLLLKATPYHKFSGSRSYMRLVDRGCSTRSSCNVQGSFKNYLRHSGSKYEWGLTWKIK